MAQSCWTGHRRSSALLQLQLAAGGGGGGGGAAVAIPVGPDHSPDSADSLAHHLHHHLQYRHVAADVEDELAMETIERLASENAVVMFSLSSCCMCHVVKRLLCGMGVNLTVYELDELEAMGGQQLMNALARFVGSADAAVPAVFIGGKFVGGLDHVMAAHISGALVPLLKQAGALWL